MLSLGKASVFELELVGVSELVGNSLRSPRQDWFLTDKAPARLATHHSGVSPRLLILLLISFIGRQALCIGD